MKNKTICWVAGALLAFLPAASFSQEPANKIFDAATTVKVFYAFHFSHNFDFSERAIKLRHRWLDENLYNLLLAEWKKSNSSANQDEIPDLDGDPFTNSQDPPTNFRVGKSTQDEKSASVIVFFIWKEKGKVVEERQVEVKLTKSATGWKIANIISGKEEDDDLLRLLKRSG